MATPVRLDITSETSNAEQGLGRVSVKLGELEARARKAASASKELGDTTAAAGDRGGEAIGRATKGAEALEARMTAAAAAAGALLVVLDKIADAEKRRDNAARSAGSAFQQTLAETGRVMNSTQIGNGLRKIMAEGDYSANQVVGAFGARAKALPNEKDDDTVKAVGELLKAADAFKIDDPSQFVDAASRLQKLDPGLSTAKAGEIVQRMREAGVGLGDVAGYAERIGNVNVAAAGAIAAKNAGQDVKQVEGLMAAIVKAQSAPPQMIATTPGGKKSIALPGGPAWLYDASGLPRDPADVLAAGLGGQIPGFDAFVEDDLSGRKRAAVSAIVRQGGFGAAMAKVRSADGTLGTAYEFMRGSATDPLSMAGDSDDLRDTEANKLALKQIEAASKSESLRREERIQANQNAFRESTAGEAYLSMTPEAIQRTAFGGPSFGSSMIDQFVQGAQAPAVNVSGPSGTQIDVRIRQGTGRATPDAP